MHLHIKKIAICSGVIALGLCGRFIFNKYAKPYLVDKAFNHKFGKRFVELASKFSLYRWAFHAPRTSPNVILPLYQMMKDVHEILSYSEIEYHIDGGTLLGAVRHSGIIPWDDDLDIMIHEKHQDNFVTKVVPLLYKLGYQILIEKGYARVYCTPLINPWLNDMANAPVLGLDIFFCHDAANASLVIDEAEWPSPLYLCDLFPLKLYQFGDFKVWGPNNPRPYLTELYGANCYHIACKGMDHAFYENHSMTPFSVEKETAAAQPFGPLLERVAIFLNPSSTSEELKQLICTPKAGGVKAQQGMYYHGWDW